MPFMIIPERTEAEKDIVLVRGEDYFLTSTDKVVMFPIKSKDKETGLIVIGKVQFAYDLIVHSKSGALGESVNQEYNSVFILGKQVISLLNDYQFTILPEDGQQDEEFLTAKQRLRNLNKWSILRETHFEGMLPDPTKFDITVIVPHQPNNKKRKLYTAWEHARLLLKEREGIFIKYRDQLFVHVGWKGLIEVVKGHCHFVSRGSKSLDFHLSPDFFNFNRFFSRFCCF